MLGDGYACPKVCSRASLSSYPCAGSFASSASRGCRTVLPPQVEPHYLLIITAAPAFVPQEPRGLPKGHAPADHSFIMPVDTYITHVHNMNVSQIRELPNGGLVMSMRRAILAAATAAIAVGLALTGCGPDSPPSGGTAPSADGIGPITFAVGSDDAPVFTKLIKPWNEAYPDQKVSLVLLPAAENGQLAPLP